MERTFETTMAIYIADGDEYEFDLLITYQLHAGCPQTHDDQGEAEHVEIIDVHFKGGTPLPSWLTDKITADETLAMNILCDAIEIDQAEADDAREWAEQSRRDQLMGGF